MESVITSAVIPSLRLEVGEKVYTVEFPLSAIAKAEEKTGRSMIDPREWLSLSVKNIPAVLEAGLVTHHPDISPADIEAICERLNPEALDEMQYALCKLAFPRYMARLEEMTAKKSASPNAPGGDAH